MEMRYERDLLVSIGKGSYLADKFGGSLNGLAKMMIRQANKIYF
jgi:hypothetical protein